MLEVHGWEELQGEANRLSREGDWAGMAGLVDDEMLHTFAVVGEPADVARQISERFSGKVERLSPVIYQPDVALQGALLEALENAA